MNVSKDDFLSLGITQVPSKSYDEEKTSENYVKICQGLHLSEEIVSEVIFSQYWSFLFCAI